MTPLNPNTAHCHQDEGNIFGGCTALISIERPTVSGEEVPPGKQFHLLTEYKLRPSERGCLALDLGTGSLMFEVAKQEFHASTRVRNPNRSWPSRMALVLSQHDLLDLPLHGQRIEMFGFHHCPLDEEALRGMGFK